MSRMTRSTLVPAAMLVVALSGCGDGDGDGPISPDPEGHEEPGDNPEGAPDGGLGDDPTESEQEGRLQPGDPEP